MNYNFTLPDFEGAEFEMEISIWTGGVKLSKDGMPLEQSSEDGKPFLIPDGRGNIIKAYPKRSFPNSVPSLEINGVKSQIAPSLKVHEYIIGGLPLLLVFAGGLLGGIIGAVGVITNYNILREEDTILSKYIKVFSITFGCYLGYFLVALLVSLALR